MKHLLAVFFLFASGLPALAQSCTVYPVGERVYFAEAGRPFEKRNIRDITLTPVSSYIVALGERGTVLRYLLAAEFLKKDGTPWGSSPQAACDAFVAAIGGGSGGGGSLTSGQVATQISDSLVASRLYLDESSFEGNGTSGNPYKALPARGFNPRGAWVASTLYLIDDIVTRAGNTYRVTANHTSPGTFTTTNLELWAANGTNGQDGNNLNADYTLFSGMVFETEPIATSVSNVTLTSGQTYTRRFVAPKTGSVTSLAFRVATAGATLTAGAENNGIALLNSSGTRLGIADCNTAYTTTGDKSVALDVSVSLTAGTVYYLAIITTGTTPAVLTGTSGSNLINLNQTTAPWNHGRTNSTLGSTVALTGGSVFDARSTARVFVAGF